MRYISDSVIVRPNLMLQFRRGLPNLGRHDVRWARMHDLSLMMSDMSRWSLGLGTVITNDCYPSSVDNH